MPDEIVKKKKKKVLGMGITGDTAKRISELHDLSSMSYTQILKQLMNIADKYYGMKRRMDKITENLSKGQPHYLEPPPVVISKRIKPTQIDTFFTDDLRGDFLKELKQAIGLKPHEIVELLNRESAEVSEDA